MFAKKSKRRIDVNSVSLVDLKAEIARRQVDVKSKVTVLPNGCNVITAQSFGADSRPIFKKTPEPKHEQSIPSSVNESSVSNAELTQLERIRKTLEAKAKLYDALKQAAIEGKCPSHPDEDIAPLVDFERKAMELPPEHDTTSRDYVNSGDESDSDHEMNNHLRKTEPVSIPDGPITYAHLRQGEVRDHGVGFYAFSADAEQRASELASLRELRKATEQARVRADKTREKRDIQMGQRLAKLRARKGLPDVATAVAQCLGELTPVSTSSEEKVIEPSYSGVGCSDLSLGSDDLDIASMLRRLRDEAEVRTAELESAVSVQPPPTAVSEPRPRFLTDTKKRAREWDRGKSLISSKIFIDRESHDFEFAPPSIY